MLAAASQHLISRREVGGEAEGVGEELRGGVGEKVEGGDVQPPPPLSKKQNTHTHLSKTNLGVNHESAKQDTKTLFRTFPKLQEARLGKTNIIGWLGV